MLSLLVLSFIFTFVFSTMLYIPLPPRQPFCINQQLPNQLLLKISMNNTLPLQLMIHKQSSLLLAQSNLTTQTILYTSLETADYKICWVNYQQKVARLGFQFAIGLKANDFHSTVDQSSNEKLANVAYHGSVLSKSILETTKHFNFMLQEKESKNTGASWTTLVLSIVFVAVAGILLVIQYRVVKTEIQGKKSI